MVAEDERYGFARRLGARSPRLLGAVQVGLSFLVLGADLWFVVALQRFSRTLWILGCLVAGAGLWTLLTGETNIGRPKPPSWWRVGYGLSITVGLLLGVYIAFVVFQGRPG